MTTTLKKPTVLPKIKPITYFKKTRINSSKYRVEGCGFLFIYDRREEKLYINQTDTIPTDKESLKRHIECHRLRNSLSSDALATQLRRDLDFINLFE